MPLTSAARYISLLDESAPELKVFALSCLNDVVDLFWAEIADHVGKIELLHEDPNFNQNTLAALVASKVYYHLGSYDDSLNYALCAEDLFNVNSSSEFVETIIAKCIDRYISIRVKQYDEDSEHGSTISNNTIKIGPGDGIDKELYPKLEQVVNRMFDRCFDHKQFRQAVGISLEARRLDMFEKAFHLCDDKQEVLTYAYRIALTLVDKKAFRSELLKVLVKLYKTLSNPDYVGVCQCLIFLADPKSTADILEKLITGPESSVLMAYQIGFDLYENSTQQFLHSVTKYLETSSSLPKATTNATPVADDVDLDADVAVDKVILQRVKHLKSIISGEKVIDLHLQFLIRNNKTDMKLLDKIKEDVRNTITHTATVIANGFMHCGTTCDQFLRDNLDWLGRAINWAKFTAISSLGVIHKGHEKEALKLMSSYLPKDGAAGSSVYAEGGSLYALGLIHASHGGDKMTDYLLQQLKEATAEPVRHGGCLGLGLAAMGTCRADVYDQIRENLYQDDAVTGEAAGLALGLVMLGSRDKNTIDDMLTYAKDTAHEKIQRGVALGLAVVMYGRMQEADSLIETLITDKDPILRWSGMATIAMAYCGSGQNSAVRKLLHAAVSDTNDDVRRWAVSAIGFIMFKTPEQVPALVSLLSESYNPHVRYGAAMAVGLACSGTALKEAIAVVEPLTQDSVHFVRQGALVAMSLLLIQQNGVTCPKSTEFREQLLKIISDKHDDVMAKYGAILAMGIMEAGGRNLSISLQTRTGHNNMMSAVGLLVFQNFWYWYPLAHFICLSFIPTAVILLNKDLSMPAGEFRSNAKPSTFAYPPAYAVQTEKKKEKVETAVLSITAKQRKKEGDKKGKTDDQKMEVDTPSSSAADTKSEVDKPSEAEKEAEPKFSMLLNPARVMRAQLRVLNLPEDSRYVPLKPISQGGIIIVRDEKPDEKEILVEDVKAHGPSTDGDDLAEPEPPEPFQWTE